MAAFETLLRHFCTRPEVLDDSLLLQPFVTRSGSALEKAWYAWIMAQRAFEHRDPRLALVWLDAGNDYAEESGDFLVAAEYAAASANCWFALDEPKTAAQPALRSWQMWLSLASNPSKDTIVPSAYALLVVLSEPHPAPKLRDEEIFSSWLLDRLTMCYLGAAYAAMKIYSDFKQLELAKSVADAFLGWADRYASRGPLSNMSGLLTARILITLGDVYDQCGDSVGALAVFRDGLGHLENLPDLDEVVRLRGELRFNAANQLGKLGLHEEALSEYKASNSILEGVGNHETILRGRYAICITRFHLGERRQIEEELSSLADEYEEIIAKAQPGPQLVAAWQTLDRIYRLWLRLTIERYDSNNNTEVLFVLHQLFALKEEEGKLIKVWSQVLQRPGASLLSEVTVMLERAGRRKDLGIFVVEQVVDALLFVSIAPGLTPWNERIAVQLVTEADKLDAIMQLITQHRSVVDRLVNRSLAIRSAPEPSFVDACQKAWSVLSASIRNHLAAASTLMVCTDSETDLDEFPVELLHDGSNYLGLHKNVVRTPSFRDLNILLCDNRTNARSTGTAIVLRADDNLPQADAEVNIVSKSMEALGFRSNVLKSPPEQTLLERLGEGVDVLHYVGHGLADEIGEELPLGQESWLTARSIESLHPAPAPVVIMSACFVGRSRRLRTGHEQGFATQFLRRGSPAVVAAFYLVPDRLAVEFAELLYYFMKSDTLSGALLTTRMALAEEKCHPAAWASFVMFGRPDVRITEPHASEVTMWPAAVFRYLATGSDAHLERALSLLAQDERLTMENRNCVKQDLTKLACSDAVYFHPKLLSVSNGLEDIPEAFIADHMLRIFGLIRYANFEGVNKQTGYRDASIHQALEASVILGDTYLFIAAAVELWRHTMYYLQQEGKSVALRARRRLRWLSGEGAGLEKAHSIIDLKEA